MGKAGRDQYIKGDFMDKEITKVVFRVLHRNPAYLDNIIALFPFNAEGPERCASYMHIGQHSPANYSHCIAKSRRARAKEYAPLKKELESLGYNLKVMQKYYRGERTRK